MKEKSIRARVAYGILCLENILIFKKYELNKWKVVLDKMWAYCNSDVGLWHEYFSEMTPFSILQEIDFEEKGCDYISKSEHDELFVLYINTEKDVLDVIDLIFEVATKDLYSSITNNSPETLTYVNKINEVLIRNNINLPVEDIFISYPISENNGWGREFCRKDIIH